jgi:hypothetical protein
VQADNSRQSLNLSIHNYRNLICAILRWQANYFILSSKQEFYAKSSLQSPSTIVYTRAWSISLSAIISRNYPKIIVGRLPPSLVYRVSSTRLALLRLIFHTSTSCSSRSTYQFYRDQPYSAQLLHLATICKYRWICGWLGLKDKIHLGTPNRILLCHVFQKVSHHTSFRWVWWLI